MAEQTDDSSLVKKRPCNSSSDLESEKPPSKMANKDTTETTNDELKKFMLDLKNDQQALRKLNGSKMDKLRNKIVSMLDTKMKSLKEEVFTELGRMGKKMEEIKERIVASELNDPIGNSLECQIGSFSSEATV